MYEDFSSSEQMVMDNEELKICQINVTLEEILVVYIQVRQLSEYKLIIEHAAVFGSKERGSVWGQSKLHMFRALSDIANESIGYFQTFYPDDSIYHFIKWISKYSNLFIAKCKRCGKSFLETQNGSMLPLYRSFEIENKETYHLDCFNM